MVGPLGGQDLLFSERFLAGGSRTVRGVDENNLGPRDFLGDPAGGQVMLVLNQEARVPIYKWVGGVAFIDSGNIFRQPRDFTFGNLTTSVGAGLRLSTPFALLRADYGGCHGRALQPPAPARPWRTAVVLRNRSGFLGLPAAHRFHDLHHFRSFGCVGASLRNCSKN